MSQPLANSPALPSASLPSGAFSRSRFYLFAGVPVVALLFAGGGRWMRLPGSDPRLVTREFHRLESKLDRRLYAPTAMPPGLNLSPDDSPIAGAHRVMQAYVSQSAEWGLIVAQELRNADRDAYHRRVFMAKPDRRVDLNGKTGFFVTGQTGERRLFWEEADAALIISSGNLPDESLVAVALTVRPWPDR
jgi:hypothetical protein